MTPTVTVNEIMGLLGLKRKLVSNFLKNTGLEPITRTSKGYLYSYDAVISELCRRGWRPSTIYYNSKQAAEYLGVALTTFYGWVDREIVSADMRLSSGSVYYAQETLDQLKWRGTGRYKASVELAEELGLPYIVLYTYLVESNFPYKALSEKGETVKRYYDVDKVIEMLKRLGWKPGYCYCLSVDLARETGVSWGRIRSLLNSRGLKPSFCLKTNDRTYAFWERDSAVSCISRKEEDPRDQYMTKIDICNHYGVSFNFIYLKEKQGLLKSIRFSSDVKYLKIDVDAIFKNLGFNPSMHYVSAKALANLYGVTEPWFKDFCKERGITPDVVLPNTTQAWFFVESKKSMFADLLASHDSLSIMGASKLFGISPNLCRTLFKEYGLQPVSSNIRVLCYNRKDLYDFFTRYGWREGEAYYYIGDICKYYNISESLLISYKASGKLKPEFYIPNSVSKYSKTQVEELLKV